METPAEAEAARWAVFRIGETSATEGAGSKRIMHLMGSLQLRYVSVSHGRPEYGIMSV